VTFARAADGSRLHVEATGEGTAVVFIHEFGGSARSFDAQVAVFKAKHRCIAYNARGYPPSDVPASVEAYSQDIAAGDVIAVLDAQRIRSAHLVGVSMGAAAALQVCLNRPERVLSATLASIGTGSDAKPEELEKQMENMARLIESQGLANLALSMANQPARRMLKDKNPVEHENFVNGLRALSAEGMANTMRGVQKRRPPLYAHEPKLKQVERPVLVIVGGDDAGCIKPSEFLARTLPDARLAVFPGTGHLVNLEEVERFNELVGSFVTAVDAKAGA
jgi:pimeloyl-ACP methyl ester carboxylesterase